MPEVLCIKNQTVNGLHIKAPVKLLQDVFIAESEDF